MVAAIFGVILILAGIGLGLYLGVWWAFIGGIIQIVTSFQPVLGQSGPNTQMLAFGILRMLSASLIGWLSVVVVSFPGFALLGVKPRVTRSHRVR